MQSIVTRIGDQLVQITRNRTDVLGDAPFVIVENSDEPFGGVCNVVERFERDAVRQGGIAENADNMLISPALVSRRRHAERGRKGGPGMSCAVTVMLTLRAQREPVQAVRRADRMKAVATARQNLMDVTLM